MDRAEVLRRLDDSRRQVFMVGSRGQRLSRVTRASGVEGDWYQVAWSGLDAREAEACIDEEVEYHRRLGVEFEWTVYGHDSPPDLRQRLEGRGFEVGPREAVMVIDLFEEPDWLDQASELSVVRVTTPQQVRLFSSLGNRAFGRAPSAGLDPRSRELLQALELGSEQHIGYIGYSGGRAASVGRLYTHPDSDFAGLYGGGTLPEHRGVGAYRAVVAARARDARRLGARYLRVDALPTSQPILTRLGFVELTETWPCTLLCVRP